MNKSKLRDELFNKYFENEEGVKLSDLVQILSPLTETGKHIKKILHENVQGFCPFSTIYAIKSIEHDNNHYLMIRSGAFNYIVVDLTEKKVMDKNSIKEMFDEESFISLIVYDQESAEDIRNNGLNTVRFLPSKKDISKLVDFYFANKGILESYQNICYRINIENARTQININLLNDDIQLSFETPDQFLYEQIFFRGDLTPSGLQDAHDKIGKERMLEIIDKVKDIRIPSCLVPTIVFENNLPQNDISQKSESIRPKQFNKNLTE